MELQASRDLVAVGFCLAFAKTTLGSDGRLCDRLHLVSTLETPVHAFDIDQHPSPDACMSRTTRCAPIGILPRGCSRVSQYGLSSRDTQSCATWTASYFDGDVQLGL